MSLLQMSFSGALMIFVIAAIRALAINRLPKRAFFVLWTIVLVRLLLPYSLPSALSVYSLAARLITTAGGPKDISAVRILPILAEHTVPAPSAVNTTVHSVDLWAAVWSIGALACAVFFTISYLRCRREFRESIPIDNSYTRQWLGGHRLYRPIAIRQSDKISTPLTYGVFRPVILMPKTTDWGGLDTLNYVLAHEYVHILRFDTVTKLVLTAAVCVHWFNPAVWIMYVLANRDIELSCDEAVIRRFGESTKSAYAMALVRMEEKRSGLTPLCNNFSKNAIEERITAIMKIKKTSLTALFVAAALTTGVTAAFATSGQPAAAKGPDTAADPDTIQTAEQDVMITSYTDPKDGKTYYSWDNGKNWTAMTDEEFKAYSSESDIEWWTAEEYAAWLENEKKELQSIIGSQGWTQSTGWFTWTQKMVDDTIAGYEQVLKNIQNGMKLSKPTSDNKDTMIMFSYDPALVQTSIEASDVNMVIGAERNYEAKLLEEYAAYGLTYDKAKDAMYFHGKLVRYFFDGVDIENGTATVYDFLNEEGVVDVHTVRQATINADGSTNPTGKLTGIEAYHQQEFDNRDISALKNVQERIAYAFCAGTPGITFTERFSKYKDYGITYVEAKGASGAGNVYYNGHLVHQFADVSPDGGAFSFTSAEQGGINVRTVYDSSGKLAGIEIC